MPTTFAPIGVGVIGRTAAATLRHPTYSAR